MNKRLASMMAAIFLAAGLAALADDAWLTDFDAARKAAAEKKLPVFALFTGSDWCPWCVKLDKEILSQKAFLDYADKNLILFKADFPRRKKVDPALQKANHALREKYGVKGFPTVVLVNADGSVVGTIYYEEGGPEKYVASLKKLLGEAKNGKE